MQNIKKTNDPIPRKVRYRRADYLTNGPEFIDAKNAILHISRLVQHTAFIIGSF